MKDILIQNKYRIVQKIAVGGWSTVYSGIDIELGEEVAIKLENSGIADWPIVAKESVAYEILSGGVGIPNMRWIGDEGDFNILIADLLGPSLSDLFEFCDSKFSLKTILLLADQMICRIKYVHSKSLLHLDIKPQNFLMGTGKLGNLVHIIDFGISRQYKDQHTKEHRPCREGVPLAGTYDFISINTHLGITPSRRDDLESLGYVLLYFLRGSLPWLSSQDTTSARHATKDEIIESIKEKKLNTPIEYLCNGLPSAFATYFNYVRSLGYDARPNYTYLRKLFSDLCAREHFSHDHMFDWTLKQFSIIHGRANQADQPPVRKRARKGRKG